MRAGLLFCLFLVCTPASQAQTFEIFNGDTVNVTDELDMKQGRWLMFYTGDSYSKYNKGQIVEELYFIDGKKEGLRKIFYPNGDIKSEITYVKNLPYGPARNFFPSGILSEEGFWDITTWKGIYRTYYENGNISNEWNFDRGMRDGIQKYYFENGQLNYIGEWKNGNETGILREYDPEGQLVAEKSYDYGILNEASTKYFPAQGIKSETASGQVPGIFTGSGYHRLMNTQGQVAREGTFDKGRLIEGKTFYYSSDGVLIRTVIFRNGKAVKDIAGK